MKDFFAQCKKAFSGQGKNTTDARDVSSVMKRVDAQIGRAVTRLAER